MTSPITVTLSLEPLTVVVNEAAATNYPILLTHHFPVLYSGVARVVNHTVDGSTIFSTVTNNFGAVSLTIFSERHHLVFNYVVGTADGIITALPVALICFGLLIVRRAVLAAGKGGGSGGRW